MNCALIVTCIDPQVWCHGDRAVGGEATLESTHVSPNTSPGLKNILRTAATVVDDVADLDNQAT